MRKIKVLVALVLAVMMTLALVGSAMADAPTGTITISNASKGIKYNIYKLFDAVVGANDAIVYTGTIPSNPASLATYFEPVPNTVNNVQATAAAKNGDALTDGAITALKDWIATNPTKAATEAEGNGSAVSFTGLGYGYYVITSTQGDGKITVVTLKGDSAEIVDKNTTTVTVGKSVNDTDVYVGQQVTYTVEVMTSNYMGEGNNAKQVVKYHFEDTLPAYLKDAAITSVTVGGTALNPTPSFENKAFDVVWATGTHGNYTSLYNNGVKIVVTYTATVTDDIYVGDANGNRNVITVTPYVDDGDQPSPWEESFHDDEIIYTYGAAIFKKDENGNALTGATFAIKGLTVTGSAGKYTVSNFNATSDTYSADLDVGSDGYLYILGLASDVNLTAKETKAPDGYNLATDELTLKPIKMSQTVTYTDKVIKYDAQGKVVYEDVTGGSSTTVTANEASLKTEANVLQVVNKTGTTLPSTGGIGTTIFYIVGAVLVLGAAAVILARRKAEQQ